MGVAISQVKALSDPIKAYQFKFEISPLPNLVGLSAKELSLRCTAASLPGSSIEQTKVNLGAHEINYPGQRKFNGNWTVSLIEGNKAQVLRVLTGWMDLCNNSETGLQSPTSLIKSTGIISLFDNSGTVVFKRRLLGVWPTEMPDIQLDMSSSEAMKIDVTFSYDNFTDSGL